MSELVRLTRTDTVGTIYPLLHLAVRSLDRSVRNIGSWRSRRAPDASYDPSRGRGKRLSACLRSIHGNQMTQSGT
jgi:hypothetical protein